MKRAEAAVGEEGAHPDLLPGGVAQVLALVAAPPQRGSERVLRLVLLDQAVDLGVAHLGDARDQIADAVAVHRPAELICASTRSPPVTATSRMFMPPKRTIFSWRDSATAQATRDQRVELGDDLAVLPVADHDLAVEPQARHDEPELPVAVGRLVQVHEVHVDLRPGQLAVELRVQVRQRLRQAALSPAIHIFAGEKVCIQVMTPTHAGSRVGFQADLRDGLGPLERRLAHHANRQLVVEMRGDLAGVLGDLLQRLLTVQVLTAGQEPDFAACFVALIRLNSFLRCVITDSVRSSSLSTNAPSAT